MLLELFYSRVPWKAELCYLDQCLKHSRYSVDICWVQVSAEETELMALRILETFSEVTVSPATLNFFKVSNFLLETLWGIRSRYFTNDTDVA